MKCLNDDGDLYCMACRALLSKQSVVLQTDLAQSA